MQQQVTASECMVMGFKLSLHVCGLATQQRRGRQVASLEDGLQALSSSLAYSSSGSPLRVPVDVQLWLGCVESRGMEGGGRFEWFGTRSRSGNFGILDWGERACGEMGAESDEEEYVFLQIR